MKEWKEMIEIMIEIMIEMKDSKEMIEIMLEAKEKIDLETETAPDIIIIIIQEKEIDKEENHDLGVITNLSKILISKNH